MAITTGQTTGTALVFDPNDVVVFSREAPNIFVDPYSNSTMNRVKFIAEEPRPRPAEGHQRAQDHIQRT